MALRLIAILCICCTLLFPVQSRGGLFGEFGLKEEMDMGREFEAMIKSSMPVVEDPEVKNYAQNLVSKIVRTLPPQPYSFATNVILNDTLNAFASPGGFIFVFTGLILNLSHESELAAVLCHEVAHVSQQHIARKVERSRVFSAATLLGILAGIAAGVAGGGDAGGAAMVGSMAAGTASMLKFSRTDESEADRVGLQYLVRSGYNPRGMLGAFETLKKMDWIRSSAFPSYLMTHPDIDARLAAIRADLQGFSGSVLARRDDDRSFLRIKTLLMARHGSPDVARQFFSKSLRDGALAGMGKAILAARENRIKDADACFRQALKSSPSDGLLLREAGIFEYGRGNTDAARSLLEQALKRSPRDYYGRFFYARALNDSGDAAAAQRNFADVLRSVPKDSEVHFYYGKSLGMSGKACEGFLHLAYASLYAGDVRKAKSFRGRAAGTVRTAEEKKALASFDEAFEQHSKMLRKISTEKR